MNKLLFGILNLTALLAISSPVKAEVGVKDYNVQQQTRLEDPKSETSFEAMIQSAADAYRGLIMGENPVPEASLLNSRCIAIFPGTTSGGFLLGGIYGRGLASCKSSNDEWSQPAPVSIRGTSIGLQVGIERSDVVLFFQTPGAERALKNGLVTTGAKIDAAAGNFGKDYQQYSVPIISYARSAGAYVGIAITSSKILQDKKSALSFYGKLIDFAALLDGKIYPDRSFTSDDLLELFPEQTLYK